MTELKATLRADMIGANCDGTVPYIFYVEGDPPNNEPPDRLRSYTNGIELENLSDSINELDLYRAFYDQESVDFYKCRIVTTVKATTQLVIEEIRRVLRAKMDDDEYSVFEYDEKVEWSGPNNRRIAVFMIKANRMGTTF